MSDHVPQTFRAVVDEILRDVARAQVAADRRSETIAETYGASPILRTFPVPCLQIRSVDIDLQYALVVHDKDSKEPSSKPISRGQAIATAAKHLVGIAAETATAETANSAAAAIEPRRKKTSRRLNLDQAPLLRYFEKLLSSLSDPDDFELDVSETDSATTSASHEAANPFLERFDASLETARRQMISSQLFRGFWRALSTTDPRACEKIDQQPGIAALQKKLAEAWSPVLDGLERRLRGETDEPSPGAFRYSLILDAEELAKLPEKAVSSVSLHIDMTTEKQRGR